MNGQKGLSPFDWLGQQAGAATDVEQDLAQNEQMLREAAERQMEFARLVFDVFQTGRGPELLEALRGMTIEVPLMDVSGSFVNGEVGLSPAEWAYVREGQNSVIRMIEQKIALAKNPPEELEQETEQ